MTASPAWPGWTPSAYQPTLCTSVGTPIVPADVMPTLSTRESTPMAGMRRRLGTRAPDVAGAGEATGASGRRPAAWWSSVGAARTAAAGRPVPGKPGVEPDADGVAVPVVSASSGVPVLAAGVGVPDEDPGSGVAVPAPGVGVPAPVPGV